MTRDYQTPANPQPELGGLAYAPELWPLLGVKSHKQFKALAQERRAEQLVLRTALARVTRDYMAWMVSNKQRPMLELDDLSLVRKQELVRKFLFRCRVPMASARAWVDDERALLPTRAAQRTIARAHSTTRSIRQMIQFRERIRQHPRSVSAEDMERVYKIVRLLQVLDIVAARGVTTCLWASYRNLLALPLRPVPVSVLRELRVRRLWF